MKKKLLTVLLSATMITMLSGGASTIVLASASNQSVNLYSENSLNHFSKDLLEQVQIPDRMSPWTIIQYENNSQYNIVQGGQYCEDDIQSTPQDTFEVNLSDDDIKRNQDYENFLKEHEEELKPINIIKVENPEPCEGMQIIYDGEGFIKDIQLNEKIDTKTNYNSLSIDGESILTPRYSYKPLPRGNTSPNGTYTWGSHNNTLTVTSSLVRGVGRLTNFTDSTGEADNNLAKGDIATRGDKDNPKHGQEITVKSNGKTVSMKKRDNGSMPDAILDVWKTGVEYFGYKWSSSLSFDGEYSYKR